MVAKLCVLLALACSICVVTAFPKRKAVAAEFVRTLKSTDSLPACTHRVVYTDSVRNGLGAQIMKMAGALAVGILQGSSVHIAPQKRWNYGCAENKTWSCYFEPPTPLCRDGLTGEIMNVPELETFPERCMELTCNMLENSRQKLPSCVKLSTTEAQGCVFDTLLNLNDKKASEQLQLWRTLMGKLWAPKAEIRQSVQAIMQHMNLENVSYVGVHIRRGDKVTEIEPIPVHRYAEAIRTLAPDVHTVFAASDDFLVVQDLAELLPEYHVLSISRGNFGHLQRMRNRASFEENYKATSKLIVEVELLSKANFFVGTFSSNVGQLVHLLRPYKPESSISLDHSWAPGNAWRGDETKYCDSPLANADWCKAQR
mmetsp:Transcript_9364/g.28210  ORF Transcript_9364/g.28210 Transcript_9364/m.28210 type:complete len:370 (+) Transcript_9364:216-1325(+)